MTNIGTIEAKIKAEGFPEFANDLKKVDATMEAFAGSTQKQFRRVELSVNEVAKMMGMSGQAFEDFRSKAMKSLAAVQGSKALETMARQCGFAKDEIEKMGRQMGLTEQSIAALTTKIFGLSAPIKSTQSSVSSLTSLITPLAGAIAGAFTLGAVSSFVQEIASAKMQFEAFDRTLKLVTGSQTGASLAMESIAETSNRLGLKLTDAADGYKLIAAAARGTTLEGAETTKTFEAVASSASVLGLSASDTNGILLALSQMISKGKVQAEELRGQLGERLPGAFQIAARAMGMTTGELDKLLSSGGLATETFLPRFTAELLKSGQGATDVGNSTQAAFNRMTNSWDSLKAALGETTAFGAAIAAVNAIGSAADTVANKIRSLSETLTATKQIEDYEKRAKALKDQLGDGQGISQKISAFEYETIPREDVLEEVRRMENAANELRQKISENARREIGKKNLAAINKQNEDNLAAEKKGQEAVLDSWASSADKGKSLWAQNRKDVLAAWGKAYKGEITNDAMSVLIDESNKKYAQGLEDLGKKGQKSANAAARYAERTSAYLEQAQDQYDQLEAQLGGDSLGAKVAAIEKRYDKAASAVRQAMIGAKGSTAELNATLEVMGKSKALEILAAQADAWKKSMSDAANMLGELGRLTGDPDAIYGASMTTAQAWEADQQKRIGAIADETEKEKQLGELRQVMAFKEVEAKRQAYEGVAAVSSEYWNAEKALLDVHLGVVKANAQDELAFRVYAAQQEDELRKKQLESESQYAGTFAETFSSRWSLAFGGYKSEMTKTKESWNQMSDSIISSTNGMIDGIAGGFGDMIRNIGNGTASIEDLWKNMLSRMLDAFASFVEDLVKQQLKDMVGGLFSGSATSGQRGGGLDLSNLLKGSSSSSSGSSAYDPTLFDKLGDRIGESSGDSFLQGLQSSGSGTSLLIGDAPDIGKGIGKGLTQYQDVWNATSSRWNQGGNEAWQNGSFSSATAATDSKYSWGGAVAGAGAVAGGAMGMVNSTSALSALGSGVMAAGGVMMMIPGLQVAGAVTAAVGGLVSLFGQENKKEIKKVAEGYNIGVTGGAVNASGVDFYSDGSTVSTGVTDPDVVRKVSEAFKDAAKNVTDFSKVLGFSTKEFVKNFNFPTMNITSDQLDGYIKNGTNAMAFSALDQSGLRGAFDAVAENGEVYIDEFSRLSKAYQTVGGYTEAYGYDLETLAGITQDSIDALRATNTQVAQGTLPAMLTMAAAMGATGDIMSVLASTATDTSVALNVTDEQLSKILQADYASQIEDAVGGEDAFKTIMGNLVKNTLDNIDAYKKQATYYTDKSNEAISDLKDPSVAIDSFWASFDAAMKRGLTVDEFEAWADASSWVNNFDTISDAITDFYNTIEKLGQSLQARTYKALGMDTASSASAQIASNRWELYDADKAGYDDATISAIAYTQELERQASIQDAMANAQSAVDDATGADKTASEVAKITSEFGDWIEAARILGASESQLATLRQQETATVQATYDALAEVMAEKASDAEIRLLKAQDNDYAASIYEKLENNAKELKEAMASNLYTAESYATLVAAQTAEVAALVKAQEDALTTQFETWQSNWAKLTARQYTVAGDDPMSTWTSLVQSQREEYAQAQKDGMSAEYLAQLVQVMAGERQTAWDDAQEAAWSKRMSDLNDQISKLKDSFSDLVDDLTEAANSFGSILDEQITLVGDLFDSAKSAQSAITSTIKDLTTGDLSPLSGADKTSSLAGQIATAYQQMTTAGRGAGQISAAATLESLATDYLDALRASGDSETYLAGYIDTVTKLNQAKAITGSDVNYYARMTDLLDAEKNIMAEILAELSKQTPDIQKLQGLKDASEATQSGIQDLYGDVTDNESSWRKAVEITLAQSGQTQDNIAKLLGTGGSVGTFLSAMTTFNTTSMPTYIGQITTLLAQIASVAGNITVTPPTVPVPGTPDVTTGGTTYTAEQTALATNLRALMSYANYGGSSSWTADQILPALSTYAAWGSQFGVTASNGFSVPSDAVGAYLYAKMADWNKDTGGTHTYLEVQNSIAGLYGSAANVLAHWLEFGYNEGVPFPNVDNVMYKTAQYYKNKATSLGINPYAAAKSMASTLGMSFSPSTSTLEAIAKAHYAAYGRAEGMIQPYALGGIAPGGSWGLVGEQGPEIVRFGATTAITPHSQTKNIMGDAFADLVAEIKSMKQQLYAAARETAKNTQKLARLADDWDANGLTTKAAQ
ncbi:phage tape measure protein [Solidesulfovibrio carbinoliphilus subsp. oakridgensis]|uniref:Phage tape measure protein n=1 Tax=Solidesulfovibrio carbinoliphilus subsp. oakridgensis TaxID=694327 RepID=G7QC41_9BACT|nr:tape measure protein [Solidesulfovibrio carbinoliphilus]EHJ49487.1 phage tape measure protein [Solidesulfovibrio carbinoliphilus subsp. oakridgensis]